MARRERMSSVDTAWLRMEDPTNLMMITGIIIFEEPLPYDRLVETLEQRFIIYDRFKQRVLSPTTSMGAAYWEDDPHFDIRAHVQRLALPAPADQTVLQELVSNLMSAPLDSSKPLWQFHLIEQYEGGSVLIGRLHHCIADGIALVRVLLSMTDADREGTQLETVEPKSRRTKGPLETLLSPVFAAAKSTQKITEALFQEGMEAFRDPSRLVDIAKLGASGATALGKLTLRFPDPPTIFKGELGVIKKVAWSKPIPLNEVKAIGKVTEGTVNDVLITAVTGGLRRYMRKRGERVKGLNFRATIPVNLRPLDGPIEFGNKFGLVFLSLPVGIADPLDRLRELKRRMDDLKESAEPVVAFGLLNAIGMVPAEVENLALSLFGAKATAVMTNVPGPRQTIYLAGVPLKQLMFWVPQSGHLGLGVSIISYAGQVMVGIATDEGLVPDPDQIIKGFHREFDALMQLVRQVEENGAKKAAAAALPNIAEPHLITCEGVTKTGKPCRNKPLSGQTTCYLHQPVAEVISL